ncbi:MAG: FHA domain-containing protein [Acidimicrobiia bacterium]|nr:FHA domain-containing protein [Acidimicrobiia bacterium]
MASATEQTGGLKPALLAIVNPSGHRSRIALNQFPHHIGRQPDNQLVLRDNRVSRVHARIDVEGGNYIIEDLQSRHGVFVNGERIEGRRILASSDAITYGFPDGYQLIFLLGEPGLDRLAAQVAETSRAASGAGSNLAKLRALVEVARALQGAFSIQEVLESVVDAALAVTGSQRGFLMLKQGEELEVQVARDRTGAPLTQQDLRVPSRLISKALRERRELLSMHFDPNTEGGVSPDMSVANLELRSVVCVPLVRVRMVNTTETIHGALNETVGLLYLDSRSDLADLSSGNRELLQTLALEASTVLENARLLEQERAKQRLEEELRIARVIQHSLQPRRLPQTGWYRVAGSSTASQQVGGDYFDLLELHPDCWALVVADVSGKGVSSALLAALLQGAFLTAGEEPEQIQQMLARMNRYLYERTEGEKYATLFYSAVTRNGQMHWSNAGHCEPVLLGTDAAVRRLPSLSVPLGMLEGMEFPVQSTSLQPGDKIILFSDGLSEAQNENGDYFGSARLMEVLSASASMDCAALHAAVLHAVEQFTGGIPQQDDITLVVAQFQP